MTFLVSLFVKSKLIVWRISAKENYFNLTKNSRKFQSSVNRRYSSLSKRSGMFRQNLLKVAVKKLNLKNLFTTHELLQNWFLRFPVGFFLTYLPIHLFQFARNHYLINNKKILNRPITKSYNGDYVNVMAAESQLTKMRPISFYEKHNLL